ncbi:hypothetical protein IW150_002076, partial [Coemansia sp. RSA 2607]
CWAENRSSCSSCSHSSRLQRVVLKRSVQVEAAEQAALSRRRLSICLCSRLHCMRRLSAADDGVAVLNPAIVVQAVPRLSIGVNGQRLLLTISFSTQTKR